MNKTREEYNAYQRGYQRGKAGRWPHDPQDIGDEQWKRVVCAAMRLSDGVDALFATYEDRDDDPVQIEIDRLRDELDTAIEATKEASHGE